MARARPHSLPSVKDVAAAANVSTATVSRVVSDSGYPVAEATRRRVLEAVQRLGYRPNDHARSLLTERTRMIGVIVPDLTNPHYPEVLRGIEGVAAGHSYSVLLCNTDGEPEKLRDCLAVFSEKRVDGVVLAGGGLDPSSALGALGDLRTPVVVVGRYRGHRHPFVTADNVAAGRAAAQHLLALGHERIGVITGPGGSTASMDRLRGCRQALRGRGLALRPDLVVPGDFGPDSGYAGAMSLLRRDRPPTAIVAANDGMAVGALAAVRDLDRAVPGDVAVVGYDDVPIASHLRPSLSTIRLPAHRMGATAMNTLLAAIRHEPVCRSTVMDVELVVRSSSADAPPASTDSRTT